MFHEYTGNWEELILSIAPIGLASELQDLLSDSASARPKRDGNDKEKQDVIPPNLKAEIASYKMAPAECGLLKDRPFSMPYNATKFATARQRTILSYPYKASKKKSVSNSNGLHASETDGNDSDSEGSSKGDVSDDGEADDSDD